MTLTLWVRVLLWDWIPVEISKETVLQIWPWTLFVIIGSTNIPIYFPLVRCSSWVLFDWAICAHNRFEEKRIQSNRIFVAAFVGSPSLFLSIIIYVCSQVIDQVALLANCVAYHSRLRYTRRPHIAHRGHLSSMLYRQERQKKQQGDIVRLSLNEDQLTTCYYHWQGTTINQFELWHTGLLFAIWCVTTNQVYLIAQEMEKLFKTLATLRAELINLKSNYNSSLFPRNPA